MGENSKIEWTDHTFNPWIGCTKVSPACAHCYAERDFDHRYGKAKWGPNGTRRITSNENWRKPLKWDREAKEAGVRRRVFCASLADVFEDWRGPMGDSNGLLGHVYHKSGVWGFGPDGADGSNDFLGGENVRMLTMQDVRNRLFDLIDETPHLDWLLLTKRPENVINFWRGLYRKNVWLGTSVENQTYADSRLPYLHAAKRFVGRTFISAEPLLGNLYLQGRWNGLVYNHLGDFGIDWVIAGGESGLDARPSNPNWFRLIRDQCQAAGVPFLFKQWGEWDERTNRTGKKFAGRILDGRTHDDFPKPLGAS